MGILSLRDFRILQDQFSTLKTWIYIPMPIYSEFGLSANCVHWVMLGIVPICCIGSWPGDLVDFIS